MECLASGNHLKNRRRKRGLCTLSSDGARIFYLVYDLKNWTEAQSYCRQNYHDLVTISSVDDMKILNKMVEYSKMVYLTKGYYAWTGLYDPVDTWRWLMADQAFYRNGEAGFRSWANGKPGGTIQITNHCAAMNSAGLWMDTECQSVTTAFCFNITGYVTFFFINVNMTWPQAQKYCRTHYTDLASVRNQAENQMIAQQVPSGKTVWIGLYRDTWSWSDGSDVSFRYWRQDTVEPNGKGYEPCVTIDFSTNGYWEDWPCDYKKEFFCYDLVIKKKVIQLSLWNQDPSLNLNDPAVMEDMLKQIQQKLKDVGQTVDVKLSWRKQSDEKVFHKEEKEKEEKYNCNDM
ncbi:C-type mannose receptor 2-like [Channa argus]|uniref:C-type mannose receptor 2-like n=1 Tax=Channa argus TaxID=215402 RepID=UPI0035212491